VKDQFLRGKIERVSVWHAGGSRRQRQYSIAAIVTLAAGYDGTLTHAGFANGGAAPGIRRGWLAMTMFRRKMPVEPRLLSAGI
jgi:hypothetical protein